MFYRILVITMEIQSSYVSYLFAIGLGQTAILFTALLKSRQQKSKSRIFFLMILVIMAIEIFYGLLYQTQGIFQTPHLLRINTPIVLLVAPTIYLTILYIFDSNRAWTIKQYWHFAPFLLAIGYFAPLYFSSASTKIGYLEVMFNETHPDSFIFGAIRRIQQGVYLIAAGHILWKNKTSLPAFRKVNFFRAVFAVFCLFSFMWLLDIYRYFFAFDLYTGMVNTILMSSMLLYFTFKIVSDQPLFDSDRTPEKYNSSGLDSEREVQIANDINSILKRKKLYLDPDLKLSKVSTELSIPTAYLSQSINNQLNKGFSELINEWRVNEAKHLLEDSKNHKLKLSYIATQAGFKSTSRFNASFKENTGFTPSQYRKKFR